LHELVPAATALALLVNPGNITQTEAQTELTEAAVHRFGLRLQVLNASTTSELDQAFATLAERRVGGVVVGGDPFFTSQRDRLVGLAARHKLPAVYNLRQFVATGGLMSYGTSIADVYRQAGVYCGQILNGAKPSDLPVMLPTKFELVINVKVAKALGLTIPPSLLARADEVIE